MIPSGFHGLGPWLGLVEKPFGLGIGLGLGLEEQLHGLGQVDRFDPLPGKAALP